MSDPTPSVLPTAKKHTWTPKPAPLEDNVKSLEKEVASMKLVLKEWRSSKSCDQETKDWEDGTRKYYIAIVDVIKTFCTDIHLTLMFGIRIYRYRLTITINYDTLVYTFIQLIKTGLQSK